MDIEMEENALIENVTYDELSIGQSARLLRTLTLEDIQAFAAVSGDTNPAHLDPEYANDTMFHGVIAHGMWGGALISALLGTKFPGPGTIYLQQDLHFSKPVRIGDTLAVVATVQSKDDEKKRVELDCVVQNQNGEKVLHGTARIIAPTQKIARPRLSVPHIQIFDPEARFHELLGKARNLDPVFCAVVHPCDVESLMGAVDSAVAGLIKPILIGPAKKILSIAAAASINISPYELIDVPHSHAAADKAADMAVDRKVEMMMKGSLHTDELLHAILARPQLRTGRRMSHVFRFDIPMYSKPLLVTDAALNIHPTLMEKVDIIQNAIDFSVIMGIPNPKVAILSAVEMVNPDIPSTIEAAALCKMAQRGQIKGGILDGPLAFDNAISLHAAQIKGIDSVVAGDADILNVPDLESGNMLAKQLEYFAGASGAGLVLGSKIPVALTSRADSARTRVASAVLGLLVAHAHRQNSQ
ncbi:bifunctional enoyl-CoA hydratase/phosphate acetyltransferase [Polynucleobacter sp. MWH-UH2A]|uniref:bifunctional enoyl-CoA hydratase/phosphate acetyltransferase n=1 Tax=Polynucleobacter sp. MWH-UH2A TaxID=1855617 RepID=UPI001BFD54D9|nr:bifunctional enoyl-CoA hydratase/phosphate acetyltransferase [Polynucleobacter sp. MWH-UH2A]QWD63706.1 bifunctional enoyl-CoA hydratase/phosphate acetyltransferase [Polynucleobacter sp. MWH-UH2A]